MILVFAPTDDVPTHHFARAGNELRMRMPLGKLPCAFGRIDDVRIANVVVEVPHSIIKSNDAGNGQCAFDLDWRLRTRAAIQYQAVQPAFTHPLHNFNRPLRLPAVFDDHVLKFPS